MPEVEKLVSSESPVPRSTFLIAHLQPLPDGFPVQILWADGRCVSHLLILPFVIASSQSTRLSTACTIFPTIFAPDIDPSIFSSHAQWIIASSKFKSLSRLINSLTYMQTGVSRRHVPELLISYIDVVILLDVRDIT